MIDFSIDEGLGARVATVTGALDDAELVRAYRTLVSSADYDASLNDLVDLRGVGRMDVSTEAIHDLGRAFKPQDDAGSASRLAIVAASDLVYGMARMYEILRSDAPEEVRVFRDIEAARDWLGQAARVQKA